MEKMNMQVQTGAAILFVLLIAGAGMALTMPGLEHWYGTLVLPAYAPPGAVIGVVWTALFGLLAAAIVLSLQATGKEFWKSLGPLYILNGAMNVLWSYVFFSLHDILAAAVTASLLAFSVGVLIVGNLKPSKTAAALLIPYFLWVSFATVLNTDIGLRNLGPADGGVAMEDTLRFTVGSTKKVDEHLTLTLKQIDDSRCPVGVQCIWQGELSPVFTAMLDGKSSEVRLGTERAKDVAVGEYHLTLIDATTESVKITVTK